MPFKKSNIDDVYENTEPQGKQKNKFSGCAGVSLSSQQFMRLRQEDHEFEATLGSVMITHFF